MHNPFKRFLLKIASPKKPIEDVKGLYLGNNHFIRVVPQPEGNPEYVSTLSGVATRFQLPTQFGNIGLIAHNYLSGKHFLELKPGDSLYIMDGFKRRKRYVVKSIHRYQALQPQSPHSHFIDLDTQELSTASDVFKRMYTGSHRVVLQTCIEKGNIKEWGRYFVVAESAPEE